MACHFGNQWEWLMWGLLTYLIWGSLSGLTMLHTTSFNAKLNGQAWSNLLLPNLFTPQFSWDDLPSPLASLWQQEARHYGNRCHILYFGLSWKCVLLTDTLKGFSQRQNIITGQINVSSKTTFINKAVKFLGQHEINLIKSCWGNICLCIIWLHWPVEDVLCVVVLWLLSPLWGKVIMLRPGL